MPILVALISGVLFGVGLFVAQMTDPSKVIGFLDLSRLGKGTWDPSLIFVMASGFAVMAVAHFIRTRRHKTLLDTDFSMPTSTIIDRKLVMGSAVFGIGWGLAGYCPGPAIASLAFLNGTSFIFVAGLALGSIGAGLALKKI